MVGHYLSTGAASGNEWVSAGYLLLPFVSGSLFGGGLVYVIRWFGWPPNVISVAPVSIMLGVLSYVVMFAIDPMLSGNFTPHAIWSGVVVALIATGPIVFVVGPLFLIYMVQLKNGRKILKDSTVFCISILSLVSEIVFVKWLFDNTS
jgi:hypothetical protein